MASDAHSAFLGARESTRRCPGCGRAQSGRNVVCSGCHRSLAGDADGPGALDGWLRRLGPDPEDGVGTIAGGGALVALMLWIGWSYASGTPLFDDQRSPSLAHHLIDMADLVFHEAGHWILAPLGRIMAVAGGSLFEILVPAVCAAALLHHGDRLGAAFGTWWTGQALTRVAVYAGDARAQRLVLLHGGTGRDAPGTHDWNNLLRWTGLLEHDHAIAWTLHGVGVLLLLLGVLWAGWLVVNAWRTQADGAAATG